MNNDLSKIKDKYGEKMMHLCRELFPTVLETPGLLFELLSKHFDYSKELYYDIINNNAVESFKEYILSLVDIKVNKVETNKSPQVLLKEVGYDLYECLTEKDINKFKKYYTSKEELCTFRGDRLHSCYVFFAVKENADRLRRESFINPERQDEYGTSVISIQFSKGNTNTLSIKNRYNHTVKNPDATFSNNLENIVPGLTESFEREYGYKIKQEESVDFELPGYVKDNRGKYYKYYLEINNIYYCENNIIIDNFEKIDTYKEKERYIFADYLIIDLKEKKVSVYDNKLDKDGILFGLLGIDNIEVKKLDNSKLIILKTKGKEDRIIEIDNTNQIIGYRNNNTTFVGSKFLTYNKKLKYLEMRNVETIGNNFLYDNLCAERIILPKVTSIGNFFLRKNISLKEIDLPSLIEVKHDFLESNEILNKINVPNLEKVGTAFLYKNNGLYEIYLPKLEIIGEMFLAHNNKIEVLELPMLKNIEMLFLDSDEVLRELILPSVKYMNFNILNKNKSLEFLYLPNYKDIQVEKYYYINPNLKRLLDEIMNSKKELMLTLK